MSSAKKIQRPAMMRIVGAALVMSMLVTEVIAGGECNCVDKLCDEGSCCSKWGYCGTGEAWCGKGNCQCQCPSNPPPPPPPLSPSGGKCNCVDKLCDEGLCCSKWGYCGTGEVWCGKDNCQCQCPSGPPPPPPSPALSPPPLPPSGGACNCADKLCDEGSCCSNWGYCGTGEAWCGKNNCQCQCPSPPPPPPPPPSSGECNCVNKLCDKGSCCSKWGYCGTGKAWCGKDNCQCQCPSILLPLGLGLRLPLGVHL